MILRTWRPIREAAEMGLEMDRIMEDILPTIKGASGCLTPQGEGHADIETGKGVITPAIDILERDTEVVVEASMPGVGKDGVEISFQNRTLSIKGDTGSGAADSAGERIYSERRRGPYSRAITIPFKVDSKGIKASLKDGVLSVRVPKAQDALAQKIQVEVTGE